MVRPDQPLAEASAPPRGAPPPTSQSGGRTSRAARRKAIPGGGRHCSTWGAETSSTGSGVWTARLWIGDQSAASGQLDPWSRWKPKSMLWRGGSACALRTPSGGFLHRTTAAPFLHASRWIAPL